MATEAQYLTGQLLIAMPQMSDPRFQRSVIYMCAHTDESAMGLVVNRLFGSITFNELLDQLGIENEGGAAGEQVHYGGPMESGRGFVLHSTDYVREGTLVIDDAFALTATVDILRAISEGTGPRHWLLCLGYASWGAGQLDGEIQRNDWLHCPADEALVFDKDLDTKWERSIAKIGVSLHLLSAEAGHA